MTEELFVCSHCGEAHAGLPTDWGFRKPDEIHALPYLEEYARVRINSDLATLDKSRYFIRGFLSLPFQEQEGCFGWGAWVEVSRKGHDLRLKYFNNDASDHPQFPGTLVNKLPGYSKTIGVPVEVQLGNSGQRPTFWLPSRSRHRLAADQSKGISAKRHHELLEACGYFENKDA